MRMFRECLVCGSELGRTRKKFCSDGCRDEYRRRNEWVNIEIGDSLEQRQREGTWDYDENDPYAETDEDKLYASENVGGLPEWKKRK